ncbi:MAG TPA: polysaccharide biosynthesis/export family protein [Novosphingobium sp.]|nr:polysaccharide biosynthesis/export family protein [Novosphingobium sp.]
MGSRSASQSGFQSAFRLIVLAVMALGLAACSARGGKIPYAPADFGPPDKQAAEDIVYDLPLGPLDMVRVSVFRVPELSSDYQVDARGMVDMPLLGLINVRDVTPTQFADELEKRYAAKYLNNPEITVRILSTNNNSVTVEGGVNAPGVYVLPGRTTLLGVMAMARGINTNDGNPRRVAIFRKKDGKTLAAAFDLVSIRRGEMDDPDIYPGDRVVVDSSQLRPAYRDVLMSIPILSLFLAL